MAPSISGGCYPVDCHSSPLPPGSNSTVTPGPGTNSTMPGVTTADIVGWVVFSLSTFLAIVTAVIVVAVVACLKKRNRRTTTGVFIVLNSFPSPIELRQYTINLLVPTDPTIG